MTGDDYPYRNKLFDDKKRIEIFKELQHMHLRLHKTQNFKGLVVNVKLPKWFYLYQGKFNYIVYDPVKYEYYMLSDLFNDECRSQCKFGKHMSPVEYYRKNKELLISKIKQKGLEVTPLNLREEIYLNHIECSTHNPLIIRYFINKFKAKNVCDISSGWGDRLIGALLSDVDNYFGADPNHCLHKNYQKIIELYKPYLKNNGTYQIIESKFENVQMPDIKFDIMYSSPPYFTYEKYEGSTAEPEFTTSVDEWLNTFLYPSIDKVINNTVNGGHLVFYFSQEKGMTYIEKWMKYMLKLPNIYYIGNFFYGDIFIRHLHPIFIFEYNKSIPESLYNPPLDIADCSFEDKNLHVIREDQLIGGSKQRAMIPYIQNILKDKKDINEFIYYGASNGYAVVALAYSLLLIKSNARIRVYSQNTKLAEALKIRKLAMSVYPNIKYIFVNGAMAVGWQMIDTYLQNNPRSFLVPFGLKDPQYKKLFYNAYQDKFLELVPKINRLWMVIGSGTIFSILYQLLPKTHFCLVIVGKNVVLDDYDSNRYTLYRSSIKLYQEIDENIPYPTTKSYDGKIFEFKKEFKDNDWLWNTAGVHQLVSN